jgi:multiple sugar transport system substrate-binding protein
MHTHAVLVALALILAPIGVKAADLVVWWEKGYYDQEDEAVREIVAAFEQETGKQVDLVFQQQNELPQKILAALDAGHPPDFAFGIWIVENVGEWAFDDRLADLSDAVGHFSDLFDSDALEREVLLNGKTGRKALYALPMANSVNHLHVWKNFLESAGFTLKDIPREWEPFWSFWCDQVQPAVRQATGRDDIYGVGLSMSASAADTYIEFFQFLAAQKVDYVTPDGRLVIDDPEVRRRLIKVIDSYTAIYRKGCTPPDSVTWFDDGNNKAFLAQAVVMTANVSLSIPNALKSQRPDDYYRNVATIQWPLGSSGEPFPIYSEISPVWFLRGQRRRLRSSSAFSWPRAGSCTISTSPASASYRRYRSSSNSHLAGYKRSAPNGGSDAALVATACPQLCRGVRRLAAPVGRPGAGLGEGDPTRCRRGHQPRAGGRRGNRPDQADPERVARVHQRR